MGSYVTKTGRAKPIGTTTRASLSVRRPSAKPLPFHLQCHPPALKRTPMHPGCKTTPRMRGETLLLLGYVPVCSFISGKHLSSDPSLPARVEVVGHATYYHADLAYAMMWKRAAQRAGLTVNVYQN